MNHDDEPTRIDYEPKTDDEIKQLAKDTHAGNVFWSTMINPDDLERMIGSIFMPMLFIDDGKRRELYEMRAVLYEYLSEAGPRSINGYPSFFSFKYVSLRDYSKVIEKYEQIKEAVDSV